MHVSISVKRAGYGFQQTDIGSFLELAISLHEGVWGGWSDSKRASLRLLPDSLHPPFSSFLFLETLGTLFHESITRERQK